jgi:hypothetical protein
MTGDPVSWFLIEPGWKVTDANGADVGKVEKVAGDSQLDIYDGLIVATGLLGKHRYVPAEQIALITEDQIQLVITRDEFEAEALEER